MPRSPSPIPLSPFKDRSDRGTVNVQVLLRCRPLCDDEIRNNDPYVVHCDEERSEVIVSSKLFDRTFTFDRVYGPETEQKDLYDESIANIVNDVLEGFNCTIFAYGQTGTGKTYTMEGLLRNSKDAEELPAGAGIIPRALQQIYNALESQRMDYSMKATYLEIYNEEITDLLAPDENLFSPSPRKPSLVLMEDGKGGVMVRGLEEELVFSEKQIFGLLERGSSKRRTAETLLNKQSNRSHSIFSIILHMRDANLVSEELIKCGRLNLVDLAGSENILRSGAREERAREAGEINKSLLTLGRVISSLAEHSGHVPYRDSKLTRLLRESLGGKTKTCIIATIAPSLRCLEETLSTLDYAYRAKNIKNRPEVNQKMRKSTLIKELYTEIEKLKTDVLAARQKNGVYIPHDHYVQEEAEKKAMSEKLRQMDCEQKLKDKQIDDMQKSLGSQGQLCGYMRAKLDEAQKRLEQTTSALYDAKEKLKQVHQWLKDRDQTIIKLEQSESSLIENAENLQSDLENCTSQISILQQQLDERNNVHLQNHKLVKEFKSELEGQLEALRELVACSVSQQQERFQSMEEQLQQFLSRKENVSEDLKSKVTSLKDSYSSGIKNLVDVVELHYNDSQAVSEKLKTVVTDQTSAREKLLLAVITEAELLLKDFQTAIHIQESEVTGFTEKMRKESLQNIEASRTISQIITGFFVDIQKTTTELGQSMSESHQMKQQYLDKLQKSYQECSRNEEEILMEKIKEMMSAANARKSEMLNAHLKHLHEIGAKDLSEMQSKVTVLNNNSSEVQSKWQGYIERAESVFTNQSAALSSKNNEFQGALLECTNDTNAARERWKGLQESLKELEGDSTVKIESIIKEELDGNNLLLTKVKETDQSIASTIKSTYTTVLKLIEGSLTVDKDTGHEALYSCCTQSAALAELKSSHHASTLDIKRRTDKCLKKDFVREEGTTATQVAESRPITPTKEHLELRCQSSPEPELPMHDFNKIITEFRERNKILLSDRSDFN
uniref:Kinesin 5a protein n=1 Tax=Marsilea vestita TaxID=59764 RepID=A0A142KW94_MARVE|nr:kinesin 5a protein [Marsilea vestita]